MMKEKTMLDLLTEHDWLDVATPLVWMVAGGDGEAEEVEAARAEGMRRNDAMEAAGEVYESGDLFLGSRCPAPRAEAVVTSFRAFCKLFPGTTLREWEASTIWNRWAALYDVEGDSVAKALIAEACDWYRRRHYYGVTRERIAARFPDMRAVWAALNK